MWTADDVKSEMLIISQLLAARRSATGDADLRAWCKGVLKESSS